MDRFRVTFTLADNAHGRRCRIVRTEDAVTVVEQSIEEDPNEYIRHRAQEIELCPSTLWRILLFEYELKLDDHQVRHMFEERTQTNISTNPNSIKKISFNE